MIHHVSIPAREPQRVAEVLAELMDGKCFPFGPLEGAFMAASGDAHGTMIEVYPERATLDIPDRDDQVVFGENQAPPRTWPFHVFLSVPLEPEQVEHVDALIDYRFSEAFGSTGLFAGVGLYRQRASLSDLAVPALQRGNQTEKRECNQ